MNPAKRRVFSFLGHGMADAIAAIRRHAELASATQHIVQAFETSGLGNKAFAEWLRIIAKDIEEVSRSRPAPLS